MRRKITIALGIILMIFVSSCTKLNEDESSATPEMFQGRTFDLRLNLAQVASQDDGHITSVRVIVYNDRGHLVSNAITHISQDQDLTVKTKAALGYNNFYIICNETAELTSQLNRSRLENQIENVTFQAAGIDSNVPMYGKVLHALVEYDTDGEQTNVTVNGATSSALYVDVNRMLAKINLTLIKNIANPDDDFVVENVKMTVCRMPRYTTIKEDQAYTSTQWADQITRVSADKLDNNGDYIVKNNNYTIPAGLDNIVFADTYICEHLLETPIYSTNSTYLLIEATCRMKNGTLQQVVSTYSINVGENPPASYNIRRNNQYNIYATIRSLGAHGIYAEIVPMDMHDIAVNWKPIEGLVIVSDKLEDYNLTTDESRNVNIWNDYSAYTGILKVFHASTGYRDVLFKYGSVFALLNNRAATVEVPFVVPPSASDQGDILWHPVTYGNPFGKINSWNDVPYIAAGNVPTGNGRIAEGLGDPCKLVGLSETQIRDEGIIDNKQWRMATIDDYRTLLSVNDLNPNAYGYRAFHYHLLPNSKYRTNDGSLTASTNGAGAYWTAADGQAFSFASQNPAAAAIDQHDPNRAYLIRCVRTSIPQTELHAVQPVTSFTYSGDTDKGISVKVTSNMPYWTATLIDDPNDPNIGTATDFGDFSFAPGQTNVRQVSGGFSTSFLTYVKRKESENARTFAVRVRGVGYDGVTVERVVVITQRGYLIQGYITNFSPALGRQESEWIPKAGQSYTCSITLTPTDVPIPRRFMSIVVSYFTTVVYQSPKIDTEDPYKYAYDNIPVVIPANLTPDVIGLAFAVKFETPGWSTDIYSYVYYQKNK